METAADSTMIMRGIVTANGVMIATGAKTGNWNRPQAPPHQAGLFSFISLVLTTGRRNNI
jgi:hypothetical protein